MKSQLLELDIAEGRRWIEEMAIFVGTMTVEAIHRFYFRFIFVRHKL